jgi:hypothetical protein
VWYPTYEHYALDLNMAKHLVEQVFIGVKSRNGNDSTFCLLIPYSLALVHSCIGPNTKRGEVYKIYTTDCRLACNIWDEL